MKTKEEILEEIFNKPETQDWYKPVLKAMETYAQQLRQPLVIKSVCEKYPKPTQRYCYECEGCKKAMSEQTGTYLRDWRTKKQVEASRSKAYKYIL